MHCTRVKDGLMHLWTRLEVGGERTLGNVTLDLAGRDRGRRCTSAGRHVSRHVFSIMLMLRLMYVRFFIYNTFSMYSCKYTRLSSPLYHEIW